MAEFEKVATLGDLSPDHMYEVEVGGEALIVANVDGTVCAFAALCSHMDGPLSQGELAGGVITCPWHGSQYDARSGAVLAGPAVDPLKTYAVRVDGDDVYVRHP